MLIEVTFVVCLYSGLLDYHSGLWVVSVPLVVIALSWEIYSYFSISVSLSHDLFTGSGVNCITQA